MNDIRPLHVMRRRLTGLPGEYATLAPVPPSAASAAWASITATRELLLENVADSPPDDVLAVLDTAIAELETIDQGVVEAPSKVRA
jgi:hypothetical protein